MTTQQSASPQELGAALAEYTAGITYESLPGEVVATLKGLVLNTLAAILAANTMGEGTPALLGWARRSGGASESTLLGVGEKVPAVTAAFVNGGMAHMVNYDDSCAHAPVHLGPVTLAPALATAEMVGGVSGREFLAGLAAGAELQARLGPALSEAQAKLPAKLQPAQAHGYFAVAVAAGRIMKFTPEQMLSAMGFALMQTAGAGQAGHEGRPGKSVYLAFPNMGGMLAAMLAREGLRNDCAVFEGDQGYFRTFSRGEFFRPPLESGLGEEFYLLNVGFKRWPVTGAAHAFIEAAISIAIANDLEPASIARVHITGPARIRPFIEPASARRTPPSPTAAADSIIFSVAKALTAREVAMVDLAPTPEGLFDPETLRIAELMECTVDETPGRTSVVEVTTTAGERYTAEVGVPMGHRDRPLSGDQLREKFLDCARYASQPISQGALEEVIDTIDRLEDVPDVRVLADLLSSRA